MSNKHSNSQYAKFDAQRTELSTYIKDGRKCLLTIDMKSWAETCNKLLNKLTNERFKVMVLGEFKRGKSTFINSLLGREILPAFATPCTAIINELSWSETPNAVLYFKNPQPVELPPGLAQKAANHIKKHSGKAVPPLPVPVEELEAYVVIPDPTQDQGKAIRETPYEKVELRWPLELLKNGVEIIDSPGTNEHASRTKITMDYLGKIDAVIFVLSVHALASQSEIGVIDRDLRGAGHEYLFFVCNRMDELKRASDRDRVTQYAYDNLAPKTSLGKEGVFFVSALDALIGREEKKPELIERSRIPIVEQALADFLVEHRGRVKLLQPAYQLMQGLKSGLFETIPHRRKMLDARVEDLEKRVREAKPQLEEAEQRKRRTLDSLERSRSRLKDAVRDSSASHLRSIADMIPDWASSLDLEKKISVMKVWGIDEQVAALGEEVLEKVQSLIEQATQNWQEERLRPLVTDHLADFQSDAREALQEFFVDIDAIRSRLSGESASAILPEARISAVERVLAGAGGFVLGGAGSAIEGATMGYQGMLRSIVPSILIAVGAVMILHLNPITIIPALIATGLFRSWRQGDKLTARAKREIGIGIRDSIIQAIPDQSNEIAEKVHENTQTLFETVSSSMERELDTIREQVNSILEIQRAGAEKIVAEREHITVVESELKKVEGAVSEFIRGLSSIK